MTPLDHALVNAQGDETYQSTFYNVFLNSEILIPIQDGTETEERRRANSNESISPVFVESEGVQYLMIFDTKERLSNWAERDINFVALPGHAIVEMMSTNFFWALNVGTEYFKTFVPEEIEWLKQTVEKSKGQKANMPAGTKVSVGAPATISAGLIDSLTSNLSRNNEVRKAFMGQVYYEMEGEKPHLALVLEIDECSSNVIDALRKDLAIATNDFLEEDECIDIMLSDESVVSKEIIRVVEPFFRRPQK